MRFGPYTIVAEETVPRGMVVFAWPDHETWKSWGMRRSHNIAIGRSPDPEPGFRGLCSCGYAGSWHTTVVEAGGDARAHVERVRSRRGVQPVHGDGGDGHQDARSGPQQPRGGP